MTMTADILERRKTKFVLWSPRVQSRAPVLVIGELELAASACGLTGGKVYHYWIEVDDSLSSAQPPSRVAVTDPFAASVDWRLFAPVVANQNPDLTQPAAVTKFVAPDQLVDADPNGE